MMYNCDYAEDTLYIQVYREFLRTARMLISDHKDKIENKKLLRVETISPKIKALIEYL